MTRTKWIFINLCRGFGNEKKNENFMTKICQFLQFSSGIQHPYIMHITVAPTTKKDHLNNGTWKWVQHKTVPNNMREWIFQSDIFSWASQCLHSKRFVVSRLNAPPARDELWRDWFPFHFFSNGSINSIQRAYYTGILPLISPLSLDGLIEKLRPKWLIRRLRWRAIYFVQKKWHRAMQIGSAQIEPKRCKWQKEEQS